jgi:hypothetical protein
LDSVRSPQQGKTRHTPAMTAAANPAVFDLRMGRSIETGLLNSEE